MLYFDAVIHHVCLWNLFVEHMKMFIWDLQVPKSRYSGLRTVVYNYENNSETFPNIRGRKINLVFINISLHLEKELVFDVSKDKKKCFSELWEHGRNFCMFSFVFRLYFPILKKIVSSQFTKKGLIYTDKKKILNSNLQLILTLNFQNKSNDLS